MEEKKKRIKKNLVRLREKENKMRKQRSAPYILTNVDYTARYMKAQ